MIQITVKLLSITATLLCIGGYASAQTNIRGLPKEATIIETQAVRSARHPDRMLVLWMLNPRKNPTNYPPDEMYSCPEQTRGSHYSGRTRVSLINARTRELINTVEIATDQDEQHGFDVPYAIRKGYYYRVPARVKTGVEAKPNLIWLRDYNGDGKPLEFALFDVVACMGLETTLIGYSEKQEQVTQYPISLQIIEGTKRLNTVTLWADYLFSQKPVRPGHWKYEIDYRGRAGSLDKWEVRYNPAKEQFDGRLTVIPGD